MSRVETPPLPNAATISEAAFQGLVEERLALEAGRLWWWHDTDARRNRAGFPDLVIVGAFGRGAIWRELKTQTGRVRPEQHDVLTRLTAAGCDAAVWRPSDWPLICDTIARLARPASRVPRPLGAP